MWMPSLEELSLLVWDLDDVSAGGVIEWPKSLRKLTVFDGAGVEGAAVPETTEIVLVSRFY